MAIYFLRHGESEANVRHVYAGQKDDSPLTIYGFEQAKQAAADIQKLKIDKIITSPLKRARDTAFIVAEEIGFDKAKIETDARLLEFDMGSLTGTPVGKLGLKDFSAEGMEDRKEFRKRVLSFLRKHRKSPKNILIVSHAGVGRAIEAARLGLEPDDIYNLMPYPNAKVVKLDLKWLD